MRLLRRSLKLARAKTTAHEGRRPPRGKVIGANTSRSQTPRDGTLRNALLDASRFLLEKEGMSALSIREVARLAGVSHQAPYHYYRDRQGILAELAAFGFDELPAVFGRGMRRASAGMRASA